MLGTIIGEMKNAYSPSLRRLRPLTSPYAAAVPRTVASPAVRNPILKLFTAASIQSRREKKFSNHRREYDGGGKRRKSAELNASGTTMMTGAARNRKMSPQKIVNVHRPTRAQALDTIWPLPR